MLPPARDSRPSPLDPASVEGALRALDLPEVLAAYLFGSHAAGRPHRESDVDVAVLLSRSLDAPARFAVRVRLASELPSLLGGRDVDVVVLNDAPPPLRAPHRAGRSGALLRRPGVGPRLPARRPAPGRRSRALPPAHAPGEAGGPRFVTYLVERLVELRRHLDHLEELRPRVPGAAALRRDLSLHNDVLFSLLTVCQLVIDVAGELAARRGARFEDYREAIRALGSDPRFPDDLVRSLEPLPGFRNVLVHEYVVLDLERAVEALSALEPVRTFANLVRQIEST